MPTALITGASLGFGRALATQLTREGWTVAVDGRRSGLLDQLGRDVGKGWPGTLISVPGDITDPAHRRQLLDAIQPLGSLDLLVNNASSLGPSPLPPLRDYPLKDLAEVYQTNVVAPLALFQLTRHLLADSRGVVVNISSDAAVEPYDGWGGYGSSKAALDQLSAVLGAEEPAISVYAFDPGDMRTAMHQQAFPGEDISDRALPGTVVPALLSLLAQRPASGRYRAADLLAQETAR